MVKRRYAKHTNKISLQKHPKFIKDSLGKVNEDKFGYDAFGLKSEIAFRRPKDYLSGYKKKIINNKIINLKTRKIILIYKFLFLNKPTSLSENVVQIQNFSSKKGITVVIVFISSFLFLVHNQLKYI